MGWALLLFLSAALLRKRGPEAPSIGSWPGADLPPVPCKGGCGLR